MLCNNKMSELTRIVNIILIDDDSISIGDINIQTDNRCIHTLSKLVKNHKYDNIVTYNENLIEIDKMKNDFKQMIKN